MNKAAESKKHEKTIVIDVEKSMWRELKKLSVEKNITMSEIARNCFQEQISNYKKDIDS